MLRLILALALILSSLFVGQSMSSRLFRRKEILSLYIKELGLASGRIEYAMDSVYELFDSFSFDTHTDFVSQWNAQVMRYRSSLRKKDIEVLREFGSGLGDSDAQSQIQRIRMYTAILQEHLKEADSDIEKKAKLYRILGFFAGTSLSLMLM